MKTILIATDFSETASNALHFAANLATGIDANLVLFNVYHLSIHASNARVSAEEMNEMVKHNNERLQELADEIATKYHLQVTVFSKTDDTIDALEQYTSSHSVDLVVMGMDSNLVEYKMFGNTTTSAIKLQKFPVLVVPNDVPFNGINKVVYACEYTFLDEDNHLDWLKDIAKAFQAKLEILHVETAANAAVLAGDHPMVSTLDALMEDIDHTYTIINNPKVGDGIAKGVEATGADLLIMVPHKAGFIESLFKGSTTREMTLKTRVPLLVLPNL